MGSNISNQITKITQDVVTNISTNLTSSNTTHVNNNQEVNIVDVSGNVVIGELDASQLVQVDVKQSMASLSENSVKDQISNDVLNASKQLVSGLNLGQVNYTSQNMESITKVVHSFANSVSQTCAATANQKQTINIKGIKGSVNLQKLVLKQVSGIASECIQSTMLNNQSFTELENKFVQDTSQTANGLDAMSLMFIALAALGFPLVGGGIFMSNLGPILIAVGAVCIVYTNVFKRTKTEFKMFSGLYNNSEKMTSSYTYANDTAVSTEAITKAFQDSEAQSFDLDRCKQQVSFYAESGKPLNQLETQTINMIPKLREKKEEVKNGDLFYDKETGNMSVKCDSVFIVIATLEKNKTYKFTYPKLELDGKQVEFKIPNLVNISGRKTTHMDPRLLIAGFVCIGVGITMLLLKNKKSN